MQRDYGLNGATLGAIGAGSYAAYLFAATVSGARARALGLRATVVCGGLLATIGMLIAGRSHSAGMLAAGVLVGGASAGVVYPPFSDAVAGLAPAMRGRTLSAINCGTGYGAAIAAPIAILVGGAWREAWLAFAGWRTRARCRSARRSRQSAVADRDRSRTAGRRRGAHRPVSSGHGAAGSDLALRTLDSPPGIRTAHGGGRNRPGHRRLSRPDTNTAATRQPRPRSRVGALGERGILLM